MTVDDDKLIERLKDAFKTLVPEDSLGAYPKEAMQPGTYVRSNRLNRLGLVVDAFYGEIDLDNNKIIIYTILILPKPISTFTRDRDSEQYYLTNEYEYETTGYLMMKPVDMKQFSKLMSGGMPF